MPADLCVELRHAVQVAAVVRVKQMRATLSAENPVQRISFAASSPDSSLIRPDSRMFVLTNVGHSTVTRTGVPDSSAARVSDSDSTPALLTL